MWHFAGTPKQTPAPRSGPVVSGQRASGAAGIWAGEFPLLTPLIAHSPSQSPHRCLQEWKVQPGAVPLILCLGGQLWAGLQPEARTSCGRCLTEAGEEGQARGWYEDLLRGWPTLLPPEGLVSRDAGDCRK